MKTALIIIDVQNILVETGFETEKLLEKIAYLQDRARNSRLKSSTCSILKHQRL